MKKAFALILLMIVAGAVRGHAQGCSTCGRVSAGGARGNDVGPDFNISLGTVQYGQSAGSLIMAASVPNPSLFTPAALQFTGSTRTDVQAITTNVISSVSTTNVETDAVLTTNFLTVSNLISTVAGMDGNLFKLSEPGGVAVDGSGNLYIADTGNNIIRKLTTNGVISVFSGNGSSGYSGDGGPATAASLNSPAEVAADGSGNIYIADTYNSAIRKVSTNGTITTVAGNGSAGYSGDGGAATNANLSYPSGVVVDNLGNIYIADTFNDRIRKVGTNGIITTVAGNGSSGYSGDGGAATSASLYDPFNVAMDNVGDIYIADTYNNAIRKVGTNGVITTVAGNGTGDYSGDGGAATNASISDPWGVSLDSFGNLYIADSGNEVIRKVGTNGIITTAAGNGSPSYSGDGGPATSASLYNPLGVAVSDSGNLYIADTDNGVVREVNTNNIITTVVGNAGAYSGNGGPATAARLNFPDDVLVSGSGVLYVADTLNNVVREIGTNGIISTVAGNGTAGYSGNGSAATNAELNSLSGIVIDGSGNLYIADTGNNVVRKVVSSTGIITTIAGNGTAGYSGDGSAATSAELNGVSGLALDGSGNIYIADTGNNVIRKVGVGGMITTVAGNGSGGYSGDGGAATGAELNHPLDVAIDGSGHLYIADEGNSAVREVSGGNISTMAGNGSPGYAGDGSAATGAELRNPSGVAVDGAGNLYIADTGNSAIREVSAGGIINTVAGNGSTGYSGDGGAASSASLDFPAGVSIDGSGNLYIADTGNSVIREVVVGSSTTDNFVYNFNQVTTTNVTTALETNAVIRQVLTPQIVADVPTPLNSSGYVINFYYATNIVGTNADGTCQVSGSPFITWLVTNSNPSATFELQVSEYGINPSYGLIKQKTYDYWPSTSSWTMQTLGGIVENMVTTNLNGSTYQIINTLQYSSGPVVQQTVNTYQILNWSTCTNVALVTNVVGVGSAAETTTYTYWDPATFGTSGLNLVKTAVHPDGSWQYYANYDNLGRRLQVYSSFEDVAVGSTSTAKETDYTYDPGTAGVSSSGDNGTLNIYTPRLIVQKIQGNEVSRSYSVFPSPGTNYQVQCTVAGAAWIAAGNLVTTNLYYTSGANQFYLKTTLFPDGTISAFNYATNGNYRTNITVTGQPDPTSSYVVNGTSNVMVLNASGFKVDSAVYDVLSGLVTSHDIYADFDSYGRPQQVTHLDTTTEYTYYACCGLNNTVDRDGVNTVYLYDLDKRQLGSEKIYSGSTNNAIANEVTLDAASRPIQSYRVGSDGSIVTMNQSGYDTAGELINQTNALGGVTSYARANNPTTGAWIRTTINPDGGVITNQYYADGSLKETSGTGVHGKGYGYGYATDVNGNTCTYTVVTNLTISGGMSPEWTKTFTDMVEHNRETLYPDGHYSQSVYNPQGQLAKQIDPDGVVTLYQYNAKGELAFNAIDMNRNGTIDFSGSDRITQTTNDVITDHSTTVNRTRNYVWLDGQSSGTLISSTESSADSLNTWQTQYRDISTGVTTHSQTVPGISRTVTTTMPDGSYAVSGYSYSRLASSTRYNSTGAQIGSTTYAYDSQGRQNTMTDARNGTTTLGFNNADLIETNITPNPGSGSPETTITLYDSTQRPDSIIQPDGTTVSSVYLLTGELGLQYGSRTYPVGYGYDYAGRVETMTNWSGFSSLAGSRVTTWNYDSQRGWLTSKAYPDGRGPAYTYTAAGRLATRVWVRGITTTYARDNAGIQTNIAYSDGVTPNVSYAYDRLGRQANVVWNGITDTMSYNLANQLLGETFAGGSLAGLSITNGYDVDLRRTSLAALSGSLQLVSDTYAYDSASRLSTVTDGNNNSATYSYVANSPLVSQIVFKQSGTLRMTTTKQYDYLNRLTQISSAPSAAVTSPLTFSYNYNPVNQRTKNTLVDGSYWIYGYDSLGQVTNACKYFADGTPVAGQQFDYTFDTIGNRTQTMAGGDTNGANLRVANYTANSLNQITNRDVPAYVDVMGASILTNTVTVNGQPAYRKGEYFRQQLPASNVSSALWTNILVAGGQNVMGNVYVAKEPETFQYDSDGNLTNDGRWAYTWDGENRLTKMVVNTNIGPQYQLTFAYDPQNRRIQKLVTTNGVGVYTNRFLYDGWNLAAILDPQSSLVASFMWGNDLSGSMQGAGGVGGLLGTIYYGTTTTNCFPAFDGNGNVMALVNSADGTIIANYEYGPFGEVMRSTGPMARLNPVRFSTKYQDDESDLLYYGERYYKPSTGTWLARDWLNEDGGLNLYAFVENDPFFSVDLLGGCSVSVGVRWHYILFGLGGENSLHLTLQADAGPCQTCITTPTVTPTITTRLGWKNDSDVNTINQSWATCCDKKCLSSYSYTRTITWRSKALKVPGAYSDSQTISITLTVSAPCSTTQSASYSEDIQGLNPITSTDLWEAQVF